MIYKKEPNPQGEGAPWNFYTFIVVLQVIFFTAKAVEEFSKRENWTGTMYLMLIIANLVAIKGRGWSDSSLTYKIVVVSTLLLFTGIFIGVGTGLLPR